MKLVTFTLADEGLKGKKIGINPAFVSAVIEIDAKETMIGLHNTPAPATVSESFTDVMIALKNER